MSPTYYKRRQQKLLERSRKGVEARLRIKAQASARTPIREWVFWRRLTDESIHRTRLVIELWCCQDEYGIIHHEIRENGKPTKYRSWRSAIRALATIH